MFSFIPYVSNFETCCWRFIIVEVLNGVEIMFMTVGGLFCQFIEVVNVENNFPLQIISCYILNK